VELLLLNDAVAMQLTDRALAPTEKEDESGLLEAIVGSAVRTAIRKPVDCPMANLQSIEIRDGALVLTNDRNQPVFTEVKVNGTDVLRGFAIADAMRFVNAFRVAKNGQH
jgi:ATP-dependent protease ClpP protease subunit